MEIDYVIKVNDHYEKRRLVLTKEHNRDFLNSFLITLDEQIDILKNDILIYFPDRATNLACPKHDDYDIQQKINILVALRKINFLTKEKIKDMLIDGEFLICECGGKMIKTPINVVFKKLGSNFVLYEDNAKNVQYNYLCENCIRAIDEQIYIQTKRNVDKRAELLRDGYNWVPNEAGLYHWEGDGCNIPPELEDKDEKDSVQRTFEYIQIPGRKNAFCKVVDINKRTGEKTNINF